MGEPGCYSPVRRGSASMAVEQGTVSLSRLVLCAPLALALAGCNSLRPQPDKSETAATPVARDPAVPRPRASIVAQARGHGGGDELPVYTFNGDHIRQDLRHELTHALLHSVLKDVPLWLDEGLAEFFELPPDVDGLNRQHL